MEVEKGSCFVPQHFNAIFKQLYKIRDKKKKNIPVGVIEREQEVERRFKRATEVRRGDWRRPTDISNVNPCS